jgi:hypothetical protein
MRHTHIKVCTAALAFIIGVLVTHFLHRNQPYPLALEQVASSSARTTLPESEITIEQDCYLTCARDQTVLRSDGSATRVISSGPNQGTYRGEIEAGDFEHLIVFIEAQGFFSLDDNYGQINYHAKTVTTSVTRSGERKEVTNWDGYTGNVKLIEIEKVIKSAVGGIKWRRVAD